MKWNRLWRSTLCATLVFGGLVAISKPQSARPNVPMTHPEWMLAIHEQNYGHTVSFVELADGRILMIGAGEFRISKDGGMSWSEPFRGKDEKGSPVDGEALVRLSGKAIGLASTRRPPGGFTIRDREALFRRSEDDGKTWSAPIVINAKGPATAVFLQDTMFRTSSGRIILPLYLGIGQPGHVRPSHQDGAPTPGAFLNGIFISIDVHYYDPSFCASYVYFSDDDGKTWQRNRDGELFINMEPGGQMERTAEPSVTEVSPGKLLMVMRTRLGRHYQAWSYNNGGEWTRPEPMHLAGNQSPAQVRTFKNGHLLCVFNQHSEEELRQGFQETRLSTAISRNGGRLWEHFQNLQSIHEETHVEPGPIRIVKAEAKYSMREGAAYENDARYAVSLPVGWGYWAYPSVLVLKDRVLISHTYSWYDENGVRQNPSGSKLKVLPIKWFYGGREPFENPTLEKLKEP